MEQGVINVAIIQNPYLMGYYSVETAMRHLAGKDVDRFIFTETRVVNKDNMFTEENQQLIFPFDNIIRD
jgi:ribose transport system substrate-binding protein